MENVIKFGRDSFWRGEGLAGIDKDDEFQKLLVGIDEKQKKQLIDFWRYGHQQAKQDKRDIYIRTAEGEIKYLACTSKEFVDQRVRELFLLNGGNYSFDSGLRVWSGSRKNCPLFQQ